MVRGATFPLQTLAQTRKKMTDRRAASEAFDKAVASYRAYVTGEEPTRQTVHQPVAPPPQHAEPVVVIATVVGMWDAATGKAFFT
jgi:hypothetical protein